MDYINNKHPQGTPYGEGDYGVGVYGQGYAVEQTRVIHAHYNVLGSMARIIHTKYIVKARYSGTEDTIDDIYCYATQRFMALGCLDGPLFPYKSRAEGVEADV